mmetsp:Transcript_28444/g.35142  ORF Transcript_28444/g.35142 Transcript_28444/m.35142 type:complete len:128 (+) Transcript_28444:1130-1513(+)
MDSTSLDYLDICALRHGIEDRDDSLKLIKLALELQLQAQAIILAQKEIQKSSFAQLCLKLQFRQASEVQRLCKYMGETESESRVKDLVFHEPTIALQDLILNTIVQPGAFEDFKASILRRHDEERKH